MAITDVNSDQSQAAALPSVLMVLAGGYGTRLRSVVNAVPKPMADVAGKPFLSYLLDYWEKQKIARVILSVGYMGNIIQSYFGNRYRSLDIKYLVEETPLGTGGAVKLALSHFCSDLGPRFLLANGDTWFPTNIKKLCEDSERLGSPITFSVKPLSNNDRYSGVELSKDGEVIKFDVSAKDSCYINAGCYLLTTDFLKTEFLRMPIKFSFEKWLAMNCERRGTLGASLQDYPFIDIGIPTDYHLAKEYFAKHRSKN